MAQGFEFTLGKKFQDLLGVPRKEGEEGDMTFSLEQEKDLAPLLKELFGAQADDSEISLSGDPEHGPQSVMLRYDHFEQPIGTFEPVLETEELQTEKRQLEPALQ